MVHLIRAKKDSDPYLAPIIFSSTARHFNPSLLYQGLVSFTLSTFPLDSERFTDGIEQRKF